MMPWARRGVLAAALAIAFYFLLGAIERAVDAARNPAMIALPQRPQPPTRASQRQRWADLVVDERALAPVGTDDPIPAREFADPFRPVKVAKIPYRVRAIIKKGDKRLALVNDQIVATGDKLQGLVVASIDANGITLEGSSGSTRIALEDAK